MPWTRSSVGPDPFRLLARRGAEVLGARVAGIVAHALIRAYQVTLSGVIGRQCRYLPTCSDYMDEAIARHGLWAGAWMGTARLCRCHPWGGSGYDPVADPPAAATWSRPWRFGRWRAGAADQDRASNSAANP